MKQRRAARCPGKKRAKRKPRKREKETPTPNHAQNRKLIGKLKRALGVFEPYVFTKIAQLPYTMYETADRLETVPDATLAAVPETRPTGKTWGGEGRYCWFLTQYTPPNQLAGQPASTCTRSLAGTRPCCG